MANGSETGGPVPRAQGGISDTLQVCRDPAPPKIFIVEDEQVFAEDLREILAGHGYCVCGSVPTGEEAIEEIRKTAPDLVLIDIILAGKMDGIGLAAAIHGSCDIPFIFLTSNSEDETIAGAKCTRPYGYIPKPFDERVLFSTIEIALFKHHTDKQIRESEIRYRTFVENIQGIAYRYDSTCSPVFFHGAIEKITGYPAADFLTGKRAWADIISPDDRDSAGFQDKNNITARIKTGSREYRIIKKDGAIRWIHDQIQIVHQPPPLLPFFEGVIYDITGLKVLETDLKKACDIRTLILLMSGHFFRRFVKDSPGRDRLKDRHTLESSILEILEGVGYEMGIHMLLLYQRTAGPGNLPVTVEKLRSVHPKHVSPTGVPGEKEVFLPTGTSALWDDQLIRGFPVFGTIDQISPKERQFFPDPSVTSMVMVPVFCRDRFWGFIQGLCFNEVHTWTEYEISSLQIAADIIATILEAGTSDEDQPGSSDTPAVPDNDTAQLPDNLMEAAVDMVFIVDFEGKILHMNRAGLGFFGIDGVPVRDAPSFEVFSAIIRENVRSYQALSPAQSGNSPREIELSTGKNSVFLDLSLSPVTSNAGTQRLFMGIARDVTGQKTLQEKQRAIQKKLHLMQKIVRHDLVNQITAIMGYLSLLKRETDNPEFTKVIEKEERVVDAIKKSLGFTRIYENLGDESAVWTGITTAFSAAWENLEPEHIRLDLPSDPLDIFIDPLFGNVVFNLLENSLRHGGKNLSAIRVSFYHAGDEVVIVYEDNGAGIPAENKEKIFNRGYYTNTGFGLLLSREILSLTGLSICETGIPGSGARFEITVPAGMWRAIGEKE
jgi:PAS domain S-box-containing protein